MTIRRDDGSDVTLPASYLVAGHLTHAYAITGHKAQGMTTQKAFVLGDQTLYREWAYVAMSRGKENNSLYVVSGIDPDRSAAGGQVERVVDPTKELVRAIGRSRAKDLALDVYEHDEIKNLGYGELRGEWEKLGKDLQDVPPDVATEIARVEADKRDLDRAMQREQEHQSRAREALRSMSFLERRRDHAAPRLERRISDADKLLSRMDSERTELQAREAVLRDQLRKREDWLIDNAPVVRRRFALEREMWWREHQSALAAEVAMPTYLRDVVGERPETPSERGAWRQAAVEAVETYRQRWGIEDPGLALGHEPKIATQKRDRAEVERQLAPERETGVSRDSEGPSVERSLEL